MSPLLAILRLCTEQYANLSEEAIRQLLDVAMSANRSAERKEIVRRTITKPVLVKGSTFKSKSGKKVTRKPHRRSKPSKRKAIS